MNTPASSKRKVTAISQPSLASVTKKAKKDDLYELRADELHEARMGLLAMQQVQMTQRHELLMEILRNYKNNVSRGGSNQAPPSFLCELNDVNIETLQ
jgi:hypothetical protein